MTAFLLTYDLRQPGRDYKNLYDAIKSGRTWWHYLESAWILDTTESADEIWQSVRPHIDANDFLLIIEVRDNVQGWLPQDAWNWIHTHLP